MAKTEIYFNDDLLEKLKLDLRKLSSQRQGHDWNIPEMGFHWDPSEPVVRDPLHLVLDRAASTASTRKKARPELAPCQQAVGRHPMKQTSTLNKVFLFIYGILYSLARVWIVARSWVTEIIPLMTMYQEADGTWVRKRV